MAKNWLKGSGKEVPEGSGKDYALVIFRKLEYNLGAGGTQFDQSCDKIGLEKK
jgi:hypothetical protein